MPWAFGESSQRQLETLNHSLRAVLTLALEVSPLDFKILEGHRDQAAQDAAFARGESKLRWPHGKHNSLPSQAVDIAPVPIDWADKERFVLLAGVVMAAATLLGIKIRWGGDWDSDGHMTDEKFRDLGHFELV